MKPMRSRQRGKVPKRGGWPRRSTVDWFKRVDRLKVDRKDVVRCCPTCHGGTFKCVGCRRFVANEVGGYDGTIASFMCAECANAWDKMVRERAHRPKRIGGGRDERKD